MRTAKTQRISIIALNILALLCLIYCAVLYLSHSSNVMNPNAMLPMQDWERGGSLLLLDPMPMLLANSLLCWLLTRDGKPKWTRMLAFLPLTVEVGLVVHEFITALI